MLIGKKGAPPIKKDGTGGKKENSGDDDEKGGGGGGFGSFWQKYILRKKKDTGGKSHSDADKPLTSAEKNQLAAEAASNTLGLDKKAREQVAKAIAAEMQRRHEEREKRRLALMKMTQVQLPWGPQPKTAPSTSFEPPPSTSSKKTYDAPPLRRYGTPSPGASVFPIKMEMRKQGAGKQMASAGSPDTWDDSQWKPVAVGPIGPSIEDKRKAWIANSLKHGQGKTAPKQVVKPKSSANTKSDSGSLSENSAKEQRQRQQQVDFGSQPENIQMDEEAVKEIHAHTLGKMLQNILVEASQQQKKAVTKNPQDMTPEELIELRRHNPSAWDNHVRQNTIISFGVTTPTDEDVDKGKRTKAKGQTMKVQFDDETDVAKAPVGRDFHFNEKTSMSQGQLKK